MAFFSTMFSFLIEGFTLIMYFILIRRYVNSKNLILQYNKIIDKNCNKNVNKTSLLPTYVNGKIIISIP